MYERSTISSNNAIVFSTFSQFKKIRHIQMTRSLDWGYYINDIREKIRVNRLFFFEITAQVFSLFGDICRISTKHSELCRVRISCQMIFEKFTQFFCFLLMISNLYADWKRYIRVKSFFAKKCRPKNEMKKIWKSFNHRVNHFLWKNQQICSQQMIEGFRAMFMFFLSN